MTFTFTPLEQADNNHIYTLEEVIFHAHAWPPEEVESFIGLQTVDGVVLYDGDAPAGYALWQVVADESEIMTIGIHPGWQGKGLGDKLLSYILSQLQNRGVKDVFLHVRVSNEPARKLYEKYGAELLHIRPKYYSAGDKIPAEDAAVYAIRQFDPALKS